MAKKWKTLRDGLAAQVGEEHLTRAAARAAAEYEADAATLRQLRQAFELTQTQLAAALAVSQAEVSRIERRSDLFLSTLTSYVEAMGGELELVARFGDSSVRLTVGDLAAESAARDPSALRAMIGSESMVAAWTALKAAMAAETDPPTSADAIAELRRRLHAWETEAERSVRA